MGSFFSQLFWFVYFFCLQIPLEITIEFFSYLTCVRDLKSVFCVCREWSDERNNELLWKKVALRKFGNIDAFFKLKPDHVTWRQMCHCTHEGEYFGEVQNGQANGFGILVRNGDSYVGTFSKGSYNGQGEFRWKSGAHYKGTWLNCMRSGQGCYTWADGSHYTGEFLDGKIHGFGVKILEGKARFEGNFVDGELHGHIKVLWTNGHSFEGKAKNGVKSGFGVYRWGDVGFYSGMWRNNNRNGFGTTTWSGGLSHIGFYQDDNRHGKGLLTWPNGDSFEGVWKKCGRVGVGTFTCLVTGVKTQQTWNEPEGSKYNERIPEKHPASIII